MTLREFFGTLWRGKLDVVGAVVVVVAAALLYVSQRDVTYEATAEVRLTAAEAAIGGGELVEVTVPVETAQLRSDEVVAAAAEALGREPADLSGRASAWVDGHTVGISVSAAEWEEATELADAFAVAYADWLEDFREEQVAYYTSRRDALAEDLASLGPVSDVDDSAVGPLAGVERDLIVSEYTTLTVELRTLEAVPEPVAVAVPTVGVTELGPALRTTVAVALLAGLVAGVGLAFVRRGLDMRIRDGEAASALTGASVLAELRNVHQSTRDLRRTGTLPVTSRAATPFTESIRELRTAIEVAVAGVPHPVVVVTAADKYEPRSFITANVAASFGLSGVRVVLVPGDLRRPRLAELLGSRRSADNHGLRVTDVPNVSFLDLPESPLDPADLLASTGVRDLVEDARARGDIVIVDAPPVLAAADATILGRYATATVLVAAAGTTNRTVLTHAVDRLRTNGVTIAGVALADVKVTRRMDYASTYGGDSTPAPAPAPAPADGGGGTTTEQPRPHPPRRARRSEPAPGADPAGTEGRVGTAGSPDETAEERSRVPPA